MYGAGIADSFDLATLTPDFFANPYPYYRALREHAPVKAMPDGSWFLTRYDDILPVYRDRRSSVPTRRRSSGRSTDRRRCSSTTRRASCSTTRRCTRASAG